MVRIGWIEDLGKNVFQLTVADVEPGDIELGEEPREYRVIATDLKQKTNAADPGPGLVARVDSVRGELNAQTRFAKFLEKHDAISVTEVDVIQAKLEEDKKTPKKKVKPVAPALAPALSKAQQDKLRHLKSLAKHQLMSEARAVGLKPTLEWDEAQLRDQIMLAAFNADGTPKEDGDDEAAAGPSEEDQLKALGYDDKQIKRMKVTAKADILKNQRHADGVSITKDGQVFIVRPTGAKADKKPQAATPPVQTPLTPITSDIIRATKGDALRALCEERGISTEGKKQPVLQVDLLEWLDAHPNDTAPAAEESDQESVQAEEPDGNGEQAGDNDVDTELKAVLAKGTPQVFKWMAERKGHLTVPLIQRLRELEREKERPRKEVLARLDATLEKMELRASKPPKAVKPARERPSGPTTLAADAPRIEVFKVSVTHKEWPFNEIKMDDDGNVESAARWYPLGQTINEADATAIGEKWSKQGYLVVIESRQTTKLDTQNTLWMDFGEPIVSKAKLKNGQPDLWVGEHLTAHLRGIGITLDEYRETTGYNGPIMVNKAAAGLSAAHNKNKNMLTMKVGQFVLNVAGDTQAIVYRLDKTSMEQMTLTIIATSTGKRIGEEVTMTPQEMFTKCSPLGHWATSTIERFKVVIPEPEVKTDEGADATAAE